MVDLTKLGKNELIKEFDIIISEWQKCKKKIKSFEAEISKIENQRIESKSIVREEIYRLRGQDEMDKIREEMKKIERKQRENIGTIDRIKKLTWSITWIVPLVIFLISIFFEFPYFLEEVLFVILFLSCGIGGLCLTIILSIILKIMLSNKKKTAADHKRKSSSLRSRSVFNKEERALFDKEDTKHYQKMKLWKEKIQQVHTEFGEFRKKRNNLAPQYYGYEVNLRNYLINGIADNLKESILRLEEDIHREKMLNVQRNIRAQMNSMENQLSSQANQLSRQANQFANELENQSNEIAYLRREIDSIR